MSQIVKCGNHCVFSSPLCLVTLLLDITEQKDLKQNGGRTVCLCQTPLPLIICFIKLQLWIYPLWSAFNYNITQCSWTLSSVDVSQNERWCKKDEQSMENSKANHYICNYESMKAFLFLPKNLGIIKFHVTDSIGQDLQRYLSLSAQFYKPVRIQKTMFRVWLNLLF